MLNRQKVGYKGSVTIRCVRGKSNHGSGEGNQMPISQSQRLRRAAERASRRKAIVTEKRKTEISTAGGREGMRDAVQAAQAPVQSCMVSEALFLNGIGWVTLARTLPAGQIGVSFFLVDVWCLGVKDAFFRLMPKSAFDEFMGAKVRDQDLVDMEPPVARKLLHDAVDYAASIGLPPSDGYAAAEALFGDIVPADETFEFGKDGKPFFVSGPNDSPSRIRRILDTLRKRLGPDGSDFLVNADGL